MMIANNDVTTFRPTPQGESAEDELKRVTLHDFEHGKQGNPKKVMTNYPTDEGKEV